MTYYYSTESGTRLFEFLAFEHTGFRSLLFVLTYPILFRRSLLLPACGFCDDFPDLTVVHPGGRLLPGVTVSETPIPPPGREPRISTDPEFVKKGWAPLPTFHEPWWIRKLAPRPTLHTVPHVRSASVTSGTKGEW